MTTDQTIVTQLVLHGNIGGMNDAQRVEYYVKLCESLGLNPVTQPFQIIKFQGREIMYATKDCAEQLRKKNGVSVTESTATQIGDVYVVSVKGQDKTGRTDVSTGAVPLTGLKGNDLANALMKAETKAKRRFTLSICGLGMLDETELDTMPDAKPIEPIDSVSMARQVIEDRIEKNMDILLPEFLTDVRSRMEGATVEVLRDIYGELRDEVKRIRAKETKAATDEGFAETAERVFNGKATKAKIPESLAKALKEKDAGEGFRDDSADLDASVKSKKEPEQQDIL